MFQVMHIVFLYEGEEWVADSGLYLTSYPPKYNIYRLSDKKHEHMECQRVYSLPLIRHMNSGDLYKFLNPNVRTFQLSSGSVDHTISLSGESHVPLTTISNDEPMKIDISKNPDTSKLLIPYMTVAEAIFIENLRASARPHSYRRISEIVAEKFPHLVPKDAVGHQWQGEEMVDLAFSIIEGMEVMEAAKNPNLQHLLDKWYI